MILQKKDWADPPRGYYFIDVKEKVILEDEMTGTKMVLIKFPIGIADKLHSHPDDDQFTYDLSGESETGDGQRISINGQFFYFPKGEMHGKTKITKETSLVCSDCFQRKIAETITNFPKGLPGYAAFLLSGSMTILSEYVFNDSGLPDLT